jgi:hypothetical protein
MDVAGSWENMEHRWAVGETMTGKIYQGHFVYEFSNGKWQISVSRLFESGGSIFTFLKLKRIKKKVCIA